jgi:hypothetical protein
MAAIAGRLRFELDRPMAAIGAMSAMFASRLSAPRRRAGRTEGDDPLGFVISLNAKRRQLSEGATMLAAAKIADLPHGLPITQADAARMFSVSLHHVKRAVAVHGYMTTTRRPHRQRPARSPPDGLLRPCRCH